MYKLLFSITSDHFEWTYTKGTGSGGQKRNKTSSAVYCFHPPSGARGYSEASRSQRDNKIDAFKKAVATKEFQDWIMLESLKQSGKMKYIETKVDQQMQDFNLKIEIRENGVWKDEYPSK